MHNDKREPDFRRCSLFVDRKSVDRKSVESRESSALGGGFAFFVMLGEELMRVRLEALDTARAAEIVRVPVVLGGGRALGDDEFLAAHGTGGAITNLRLADRHERSGLLLGAARLSRLAFALGRSGG